MNDGRAPKWTWGDAVRVQAGAPVELRPGALAEIVGMRSIEGAEPSAEVGTAIGTLYSVEFSDGESAEIPAMWLEGVEDHAD